MKLKRIFALVLATSLVLPTAASIADDDYDDIDDIYEYDDDFDDDDDDYDDDDYYDDDDDDDRYDDLDDDDDDDDDGRSRRRKSKDGGLNLTPELRVALNKAIDRSKKVLDHADKVIRTSKRTKTIEALEILVNRQKEIIKRLEVLLG